MSLLRAIVFLAFGLVLAPGPGVAAPSAGPGRVLPAQWDGFPGPLRLTLGGGPAPADGRVLVRSGPPGQRDEIVLVPIGDGHFAFDYLQGGVRQARSEAVRPEGGGPGTVIVSMGSLLPPPTSPVYWSRPRAAHLAAHVLVVSDGRTVLAMPAASSASAAAEIVVDDSLVVAVAAADEAAIAAHFLPLARPARPDDPRWQGRPGPVRLVVRPNPSTTGLQPLLSSGAVGRGDVLSWRPDGDNRIRFVFEHAGEAPIESEAFARPRGDLDLVVSTGALVPPAVTGAFPGLPLRGEDLQGRLLVRFGGATVFDRPQAFHPARPEDIVFGANTVVPRPPRRYLDGAGSVEPAGLDQVVDWTSAPLELRAGQPEWSGWPGPIRLQVMFSPKPGGKEEPLVTTGVTGAGDFLFVRYPDARSVQIGLDHWGAGGPLSDPVPIDPRQPHELVVNLGSLWPAGPTPLSAREPGLAEWRRRLVVILDGNVIFSRDLAFHASAPGEISVGANRIGGTTAAPRFSGRILGVQPASTADLPSGTK